MLFDRMLTFLVLVSTYIPFAQATVQLSFNRADVTISEGEHLPSQLSIIKNGQNEENISFHVVVIPGSARDNTDYQSNSGNPYVFTRNINHLPIRTELQQDQAGEAVENFMICLPDAQVLQAMGAEAVDPSCVTITIIDDDSVVIGFRNSFETVAEGETMTICVDVKPQGLILDPFDEVPLSLRMNPVGSETILGTNSLTFRTSNERCVTFSVVDNDVMEGSRSYQLILDNDGSSTVPVLLYPNTIPIIVIDNDGKDTSFSIDGPQPVITLLEGGRTDNISVQKSRSSALSYNVSLTSTQPSRLVDVKIPNSFIFDPSTTQRSVDIVTIDNTVSANRIEFNISIGRIVAIEAPDATNLATALEGPVKIIVFDNDFEVGFTEGQFLVTEDSSNTAVCIEITKPQASSDIEPSLVIPIEVMLENLTSSSCNLTFDKNIVVLSAHNKMGCLTLEHSGGCNGTRSYTIRLKSTIIEDQKYTVYFGRQNASISITAQDNGQASQLSSGVVVTIVIVILTVVIVFVSIASILAFIVVKKKSKHKSDSEKTLFTSVFNETEIIRESSQRESISTSVTETKCTVTNTDKPADKQQQILENLTEINISQTTQQLIRAESKSQTDDFYIDESCDENENSETQPADSSDLIDQQNEIPAGLSQGVPSMCGSTEEKSDSI